MAYTTLISTAALAEHLGDPAWAVIDCRFNLQQTEDGRIQYGTAHIPGAVYAHLDEDLSGPIIPGKTGRHPLPAVSDFAATLSAWGIEHGTQVVAYDSMGGLVAGRVWWMLRWLGHESVAVLDGDWRLWEREGRPTRAGVESRPARRFVAETWTIHNSCSVTPATPVVFGAIPVVWTLSADTFRALSAHTLPATWVLMGGS
jgi:thiosulfate/3-mercaptopyruvate sulfurtransferase